MKRVADRVASRFGALPALPLLLALAVLVALPAPAPATPVSSRVTVSGFGVADGATTAVPPGTAGEVRRLLAPHLTPSDLRRVMGNPATVSRVARLLDVTARDQGRDLFVEVEVEPSPDGGRTVYVALRHRGTLQRSGADRTYRQDSATTVGEVAIRVPPPPLPSPVIAAPALPPVAPDFLPVTPAPCAPGDADCWRRDTLRRMFDRPPTCEAYLVEQDLHLGRLATDPDPNGQAARAGTPDPGAPERERQLRMREWMGPYPSGAIDEGSGTFLRDRVTITNAPQCAPPTPAEPSDACRAEWAERSLAAVPTLACTRMLVDHEHWRGGDGLVRAAEAPFSPLGSLPIISHILAAKARKVADDTSWRGIFAVRWMERLADARNRGDTGYLDRAAANLVQSPDERRVLASNLRRWMASGTSSPWHATILSFYEERFTALYPDAADANGLPMLSRFPTRLWWATNWLSAVQRRGLAPEAAAELLRCAPNGAVSVAVLKDLAPMLASDPRFSSMLSRLTVLL